MNLCDNDIGENSFGDDDLLLPLAPFTNNGNNGDAAGSDDDIFDDILYAPLNNIPLLDDNVNNQDINDGNRVWASILPHDEDALLPPERQPEIPQLFADPFLLQPSDSRPLYSSAAALENNPHDNPKVVHRPVIANRFHLFERQRVANNNMPDKQHISVASANFVLREDNDESSANDAMYHAAESFLRNKIKSTKMPSVIKEAKFLSDYVMCNAPTTMQSVHEFALMGADLKGCAYSLDRVLTISQYLVKLWAWLKSDAEVPHAALRMASMDNLLVSRVERDHGNRRTRVTKLLRHRPLFDMYFVVSYASYKYILLRKFVR